ncbi:DUF2271 domain-containing protein [Bremerella cremea]|nr:DUF2271 domain-containing protein [Bremerella cremea]
MKLLCLFCLSVFAVSVCGPVTYAEDFRFQHEHILGTSLELIVTAKDRAEADRVESRVLHEIDRQAAIFSRYDRESQLMLWQTGQLSADNLSPELVTVLKRAEYWRAVSDGAFDVRSGALTSLWQTAADRGQAPTDQARQVILTQLDRPPYQVSEANQIKRLDSLAISLDGLAKGYILDAACEVVHREFPSVSDFTINIGGDLRKLGDAPLEISVANPRHSSEAARPLEKFVVTQPIAMATSGGYRRYLEVGGRRISHIFDPRTGLPADEVSSASVVAPNAQDADALATTLCVLGPQEGVALIEHLSATECCLVTREGEVIRSSGWPLQPQASSAQLLVMKEEEKKQDTGLFVDFSLVRPSGGRGYRRPYVAVWLEDTDGFPVKTAVLWMQTEQPGPRWHRDLTRWYRNDRLRQVVEETELIGTISSATRGPGKYDAYFDGTDNAGKPLKPGKYTLCLEVAREHGTYQLIREAIQWGDEPIAPKKLKGNVELDDVSYHFVPAKPETKSDAS